MTTQAGEGTVAHTEATVVVDFRSVLLDRPNRRPDKSRGVTVTSASHATDRLTAISRPSR